MAWRSFTVWQWLAKIQPYIMAWLLLIPQFVSFGVLFALTVKVAFKIVISGLFSQTRTRGTMCTKNTTCIAVVVYLSHLP